MSEKTAAERVALARHPQRPNITDYIDGLFTDFFEQRGDRACREDPAILGGIALFHGRPVTVIGTRKGKTLEENLRCNFGMPGPEGYRKALRLMKQAEKFRRPIFTFIDTAGAYPGLEAEEHGQGEAIARNLFEMSRLTVPVIAVVTGEGNSGGALALAVADRVLMLENYLTAFTTAKLGRLFMNTMIVGLVSTLLSLFITILTAFAFARLEFKGKELLFAALLATMMIPGELFTITNYGTVTALGWKNTYTVLIVPFLVSVFYIYLLRQSFLQIPNELYLAAKVDGTKDWKYLWKVMVPLSLPTLISITILKMMGAWNSYIWPRLVANDDAHRLITNGLRSAFTDTTGDVNYPVQMAAVALVSAPLFLVFVFLRKYIMTGVSRSGIKG